MRKLYIILLFCFCGSIFAQENFLTKEEAIAIALENNFGIKVATNDLEIAANNKSILNSGYLPTLSGSASANYNDLDSNTKYPGQFDDDGVTPRADLEIDHAESRDYSAGLSLDYTLFDGLGRFYTYKQLKEQYQLTELQARETIENTIVQMFSVYFQVAQLTENYNVLEQALEISRDRIIREEYSFEYGQNTKLDILNAQVDFTNDSILLLNAKQDLVNARRDLNVVLNQDLNKVYQVDTIVMFTPSLELDSHILKSNENNVSLLQAEKNLKINEYDIKVSKSGYLPTVDLTGEYGWNLSQSASSSFLPGQVIPGSNRNTYDLDLTASLTWNLFDGGTTSVAVRNAKIAYDNQEIVKKQLALEIERDIQNAKTIYDNLIKIYQIQEQNVLTNQNNFERSKEQFQLGRITSIEFRQAQINLLDAGTNKNLAKYDAKLAEVELLQLTGQLLNVKL
ncbi:TolC family protein [Cellulophaga baltica]|uniref:TolC family protein n=1 Tax=Cellulophaga TaxID=104264 RepID=UPI001C071A01|nr:MULTISPECIES: TolC family protein [Cellulophaga]MBU2995421.1 TolC family protein [Cellulophaga baltica]MDO6766815.1 TolC family protein [Cellulophaga sp. 1_MG-2023]